MEPESQKLSIGDLVYCQIYKCHGFIVHWREDGMYAVAIEPFSSGVKPNVPWIKGVHLDFIKSNWLPKGFDFEDGGSFQKILAEYKSGDPVTSAKSPEEAAKNISDEDKPRESFGTQNETDLKHSEDLRFSCIPEGFRPLIKYNHDFYMNELSNLLQRISALDKYFYIAGIWLLFLTYLIFQGPPHGK